MNRGRPKQPLALSADERETLRHWANRPSTPPALAERARILLACADGETNKAVARRLGVTPQTVGKWRARFLRSRLDGLLDEPRSGAPRRILESDVERVLTLTLECVGPNGGPWSTRSLAQATGLSQSAVSRIWRAYGVRPRCGEIARFWADPQFIAQVRDVVGVYADPPTFALALCADAHALPTVDRVRPAAGREGELALAESVRRPLPGLFTELPLPAGRLCTVGERRARSREFREFLDRIDSEVPRGLDVHVLLSRDGTLESSLVQSWLAARPRFQAHPIPSRLAFEELVERWLQIVGKKRRDDDPGAARRPLVRALDRHRAACVALPARLVWVKSCAEIAQALGAR